MHIWKKSASLTRRALTSCNIEQTVVETIFCVISAVGIGYTNWHWLIVYLVPLLRCCIWTSKSARNMTFIFVWLSVIVNQHANDAVKAFDFSWRNIFEIRYVNGHCLSVYIFALCIFRSTTEKCGCLLLSNLWFFEVEPSFILDWCLNDWRLVELWPNLNIALHRNKCVYQMNWLLILGNNYNGPVHWSLFGPVLRIYLAGGVLSTLFVLLIFTLCCIMYWNFKPNIFCGLVQCRSRQHF